MLSKALVSGAYQKKLEELACLPDIDLVALVPPAWHEPRVGSIRLERRFTQGYRLETVSMAFNGHHHLHFYPGLQRILRRERPDVLHIDEEAFNPATFLAMRSGRAVGARCCFFNWANIDRAYPPPFRWFEQYVFRHAAHAIAGNQEAATIIRRHGYSGPVTVLPQFGVDPQMFTPASETGDNSASLHTTDKHNAQLFVVGYVGRFVQEKGILDLIEAVAGMPPCVHLRLVGDGDLRASIEARIATLQIEQRVSITTAVGSTQVPGVLRQLDVLVLPSHTRPNWKEQFGRILIEAMSCGIPVVGSASGEIPHVIGDAGLVFPEQDPAALRATLIRLLEDSDLRQRLRHKGRERVLAHYTQAALSREYYDVYRKMLM